MGAVAMTCKLEIDTIVLAVEAVLRDRFKTNDLSPCMYSQEDGWLYRFTISTGVSLVCHQYVVPDDDRVHIWIEAGICIVPNTDLDQALMESCKFINNSFLPFKIGWHDYGINRKIFCLQYRSPSCFMNPASVGPLIDYVVEYAQEIQAEMLRKHTEATKVLAG